LLALNLSSIIRCLSCYSKGPTQQQLLDFLRSKSIDHLHLFASQLVSTILTDAAPASGARLSVANGVWIEQSLSLQPSFKQIVSSNYNATLASVDFLNKVCHIHTRLVFITIIIVHSFF